MLTGRVVFVPGTHGRSGPGIREWWHRGSPLARAFEACGYEVDNLPWTSELDGVAGPMRRWRDAGEKLGLWLQLHPATVVLAHSHGGNVAIFAAVVSRVEIPALVTLGTPVRADLATLYQRAALATGLRRWLHVYADGDLWQWWGSVRVGHPSTWMPPIRRMRWATDNVNVGADVGHRGLVDVAVLERAGLWTWLHAE